MAHLQFDATEYVIDLVVSGRFIQGTITAWKEESEFDEKYERAKCKLFAKFGVDLGNADGQAIADAAKRIYAGLPASYKANARVTPIHDNVWRCRTPEPGGPILRNSCVFTRDVRRHFDRYGARTSEDVA